MGAIVWLQLWLHFPFFARAYNCFHLDNLPYVRLRARHQEYAIEDNQYRIARASLLFSMFKPPHLLVQVCHRCRKQLDRIESRNHSIFP